MSAALRAQPARSLKPCLWTAWCDYFATGEGRTIIGYITYASSEEKMQAHFADKFGDWFGKGCEIAQGVHRNDVTRYLWSESLLNWIESCEARGGHVDVQANAHVNFS